MLLGAVGLESPPDDPRAGRPRRRAAPHVAILGPHLLAGTGNVKARAGLSDRCAVATGGRTSCSSAVLMDGDPCAPPPASAHRGARFCSRNRELQFHFWDRHGICVPILPEHQRSSPAINTAVTISQGRRRWIRTMPTMNMTN